VQSDSAGAGFLIIAVALACYFLPTIVAMIRKHRVGSVLLVNLLFGWSIIGWFWAFAMALSYASSQKVTIINQIHNDNSRSDAKRA
jgi:hypothetical protein